MQRDTTATFRALHAATTALRLPMQGLSEASMPYARLRELVFGM
jgi:hypothetical protein